MYSICIFCLLLVHVQLLLGFIWANPFNNIDQDEAIVLTPIPYAQMLKVFLLSSAFIKPLGESVVFP